jgi:hypothetical protein
MWSNTCLQKSLSFQHRWRKETWRIQKLFYQVSSELEARTAILHKIYGVDTRNKMISHYKISAQDLRSQLMVPVTIKMHYNQALALYQGGEKKEAAAAIQKVDGYLPS